MSRETKDPIRKRSYGTKNPDGWAGWVEDKQGRWILFYKTDGTARFYSQREESGAVVGEGIDSAAAHAQSPV